MSGQQPPCYGRHWDPGSRECRGGNDPTYVNPATGTNKRDICRFYGACSAATNDARLRESVGTPAPPFHLPQAPAPQAPPAPFRAPTSFGTPPNMPAPPMLPAPVQAMVVAQPQPNQQQHVVYVGQAPWTQPQYAGMPVMVPANQPMAGASVASFLTVPEPDNPDVPAMTRFMRTIARSTFKAAFLGAANFIDYSPITPPARR